MDKEGNGEEEGGGGEGKRDREREWEWGENICFYLNREKTLYWDYLVFPKSGLSC